MAQRQPVAGMASDASARGRRAGWVAGGVVAAAAVAGGLLARRRARDQAIRDDGPARVPAAPRRATLIINRWSGDGKAERVGLAEHAARLGVTTILLEPGDDLVALAEGAVAARADAIGMAGGDGSLGLVAGVAADHGVPFFCVPVGTRNHFALDLGLDRDDPLRALDALRDGEEISIDLGRANGRTFLNNVSLGVYAQAVHEDGYRGAKAETLAEKVTRAARDPDAQARLRYTTPNGVTHDRAPLLLLSNNPYVYSGPPDYGRRARLDSGELGIGAVTNFPADLDAQTPLAHLRSLHQWTAPTYVIDSDEPIQAGVDGEATVFDAPLTVSVHPSRLRVLVPRGTRPGYAPTRELVAARLLDLAETAGIGPR